MLRTPFIETLSDLFIRSAAWRGRDELFVDEENRITGTEALDQALRMAQGFADNGAAPGNVIAFLCRSSARHAVAWFAAPLGGRIACSLHVRETPEKLGRALAWLEAKVLVHDADLEAEAPDLILVVERGVLDGRARNIVEHTDLFDAEPVLWSRHAAQALDPATASFSWFVPQMGFEGFLYRCTFAGLQFAQVFDGFRGQEYLESHSG